MRLWIAVCLLVIIGAPNWNGPPTALPLPGATWGQQSLIGALIIIAVVFPLARIIPPRHYRRRR